MNPQPIPLKEWTFLESKKCGVTPHTVYVWLRQRGKYPNVKTVAIHKPRKGQVGKRISHVIIE